MEATSLGFSPAARTILAGSSSPIGNGNVGAHHHAAGAYHLHDESQHPRVMQNAVGVEQRQPCRWIGNPGRDLVVTHEATKEEGKPGGTHGSENLRVAAARYVAPSEQ